MLYTPVSARDLSQISLLKSKLLHCLEKMFFRVLGDQREYCSRGGSGLVQVPESCSLLTSHYCVCTQFFSSSWIIHFLQ